MGGKNEKPVLISSTSQLNNIHPAFKGFDLVSTNYGPMFQHKMVFDSQFLHYLPKQKIMLQELVSRYLLLPEKVLVSQSSNCGTNQQVTFYYQFFPFNLDKQIDVRRNTKKLFAQSELWYILYCGISAIFEFQKRNERLGGICPQTILLNNQGHIRLINKYSWPGADLNSYNFFTYAQQVEDNIGLFNQKSEIFCLGMVIIYCIRFQDVKIIERKRLNLQKLYVIIQSIYSTQGGYSNKLRDTVRRMVEPNSKQRPSAYQLLQQLKLYQLDILNFNKFT